MAYRGKPIIGIVGGIGSGKSFVARILSELGCAVIDSDAVAHAIYAEPAVIETLLGWYGPSVLGAGGAVNRKVLAGQVFKDAAERERLEALVHPRIHAERDREMAARANDPAVKAFVWDSPLLIEAGLHTQCDEVVFVDVPYAQRLRRVVTSRGWDAAELDRREKSQTPLESKRRLSTATVKGDGDAGELRSALERLLHAAVLRLARE